MAFPAPLPPGVGGDTYVTAPRGLEDGTKLAKMVRLAQQMTNVTLEGSAKDETVGYLVNKLVALDKIDPMAVDELQASFDRQASAMAPRNPLALLWMFFFDQMKLLKGVEELQGAFVKELNDRMKRAGL
jgi:hypothetical protein